jgi:hypothetical protein
MPQQTVTGDWEWVHYGDTLGASPSRVRIGITVTGACVVDIAAATGIFAEDVPDYIPAPTRKGVYVVGVGPEGAITPDKVARWRPATDIYIEDACLEYIKTDGTYTAKLSKGASSIFTSLSHASGSAGARTQPDTAALASVTSADFLTFEILTAAAGLRGASCEIRYVEYISPIHGLTGGGAVL